ncbi:MAG: hypothetical protein B7C24_18175 [Bacteroidetes bacterium 4572_77]|nr:MAG: hypothetical protein B7C24_18175 [Bacteroidetes bacterium 4572_77]
MFKSNKILFLFLITLIFTCNLFSEQVWYSFNDGGISEPLEIIDKSDNSQLIIEVEIPGIYMEEVTESGTTYQRLEIPQWQNMHITGEPNLPVYSSMFAIPECSGYTISLTALETTVWEDKNIYPCPVYYEMGETFSIDTALYNTNAEYPTVSYEDIGSGYFRDQRYAEVNFYPLTFNPVTQQLEILIILMSIT